MDHKITKWFALSLILAAFSVAICANTTAKMTPKAKELKSSNDTRDVANIDITLIMSGCNETFRTEMSYIESLNKTGSFPNESGKTAKCFVRCLLEKSNVISEDGVIDLEQAPAFFAAERASAVDDDFRNSTATCSNRNETCICEKSYQFVKCVVELEMNKHDFLKHVY